MSNQERSEQPVAVCAECGGTKEKPLCVRGSHKLINGNTISVKHDASGEYCERCSNPFHASTEQIRCSVCTHLLPCPHHPHRHDYSASTEPTAQTVAGEPSIVRRLNEEVAQFRNDILDLRRQLAKEIAFKDEARKQRDWLIKECERIGVLVNVAIGAPIEEAYRLVNQYGAERDAVHSITCCTWSRVTGAKQMTCLFPIELGYDVVMYCELEKGHEGEHLPTLPFNNDERILYQWWKRNHPEKLSQYIAELLK